jgi:NADH-quinone oxidoreductase subunit N
MRMPIFSFFDLGAVATPLMLGIVALACLLLDAWVGKKKPSWVGGFSMVGMLLTLAFQIILHVARVNLDDQTGAGFGGLAAFDAFSIYFNYLFLASAIMVTALSISHLEGKEYNRGEYYILILLATAGMCLLVSARDLIMVFLGLETMSIPIYALAASDRGNLKSNESGLKYLLLGGFASALLLYGMALIYGAGDSTNFFALNRSLTELKQNDIRYYFLMFWLGLFIIGFGFKVAAVPFHMWVPDVYEGAPTPITAYMAAGVKAAGFGLLLRAFMTVFNEEWVQSYNVLRAFAIGTMIVGNLIALSQSNIKRLLAYSSIAHAGYLLVGLTALVASSSPEEAQFSAQAVAYYLLVYLFMNIGAFAVVVVLGREKRGGEEVDDYAGLARSRPFLAAAMAVFMLSLAGVPPLGGFIAKLYIFQAAVKNGLYYLTIIAVVNSVVAAYYYLRVIYVMYMQKERERVVEPGFESGVLVNAVLILNMVMVIVLGLAPNAFIDLILNALKKLG